MITRMILFLMIFSMLVVAADLPEIVDDELSQRGKKETKEDLSQKAKLEFELIGGYNMGTASSEMVDAFGYSFTWGTEYDYHYKQRFEMIYPIDNIASGISVAMTGKNRSGKKYALRGKFLMSLSDPSSQHIETRRMTETSFEDGVYNMPFFKSFNDATGKGTEWSIEGIFGILKVDNFEFGGALGYDKVSYTQDLTADNAWYLENPSSVDSDTIYVTHDGEELGTSKINYSGFYIGIFAEYNLNNFLFSANLNMSPFAKATIEDEWTLNNSTATTESKDGYSLDIKANVDYYLPFTLPMNSTPYVSLSFSEKLFDLNASQTHVYGSDSHEYSATMDFERAHIALKLGLKL